MRRPGLDSLCALSGSLFCPFVETIRQLDEYLFEGNVYPGKSKLKDSLAGASNEEAAVSAPNDALFASGGFLGNPTPRISRILHLPRVPLY